jgi:hypothetical protein
MALDSIFEARSAALGCACATAHGEKPRNGSLGRPPRLLDSTVWPGLEAPISTSSCRLPSSQGPYAYQSPVFTCFGRQWPSPYLAQKLDNLWKLVVSDSGNK